MQIDIFAHQSRNRDEDKPVILKAIRRKHKGWDCSTCRAVTTTAIHSKLAPSLTMANSLRWIPCLYPGSPGSPRPPIQRIASPAGAESTGPLGIVRRAFFMPGRFNPGGRISLDKSE